MITFWRIFSTQLAKQFVFYDFSLCSLECEASLPPCFEQALWSYSKSPIPRDIFVLASSPSESNTSEKEWGRERLNWDEGAQPFCPACYIPSFHLLPGFLPDKPAIPRHKLVCPQQLLKKTWYVLALCTGIFPTTIYWVQVRPKKERLKILKMSNV